VISPLLAGNMERVVGAMLVLLGIGVVRRLWRERIHFHVHTHAQHVNVFAPQGQIIHFHAYSHAGELQPHRPSAHAHSHRLPWRRGVVGMVHGLAGSAALALFASQSMPSPAWMLVYIAVFGTRLDSRHGAAVGRTGYSVGFDCTPPHRRVSHPQQ
jgi:hypothetical protein